MLGRLVGNLAESQNAGVIDGDSVGDTSNILVSILHSELEWAIAGRNLPSFIPLGRVGERG